MTLDEDATLDAVLAGASLARFGDGEINLALGRALCVTQAPDPELQARLLVAMVAGRCLIGVPRFNIGPKAPFWSKYDRREIHALMNPNRNYGSAFVTRPDSAPWINRPDYWAKVKRLWAGKDVTLVRGSGKSLTADMLVEARQVREIVAPAKNAFAQYDALMAEIGTPETVLLCLGATATIMAEELSVKGVHAVDLGHVGMFIRKHERGAPMTVTEADRDWDRAVA